MLIISDLKHRFELYKETWIWKRSARIQKRKNPKQTPDAVQAQAEADFVWHIRAVAARWIFFTIVGFVGWILPLCISWFTWSTAQRSGITTQLIKEGWEILALKEAYILRGTNARTASLSEATNLPLIYLTSGELCLQKATLYALADQYIWTNDPSANLYHTTNLTELDSRLWILRDRVVDALSFGRDGVATHTNDPFLDPHAVVITSQGLWAIVAWIEKLSIADKAGWLDPHTKRVLQKPLAAFCGADRRRVLKYNLTPEAISFLERFEPEYGLPLNPTAKVDRNLLMKIVSAIALIGFAVLIVVMHKTVNSWESGTGNKGQRGTESQ